MNKPLRDYFEAVALGNGKLGRFVECAGDLKKPFVVLHFFLIAAMLFVPVLYAVAPLSPWELFSRLYGVDTLSQAGQINGIPVPETVREEEFNAAMYGDGYGGRILVPILLLSFGIILILQIVFYLCAALFLGLHRITGSRFSFGKRFNIFVLGSTVPVIGSSIFGLWMPAAHIIVFYLASILLGFHASNRYDSAAKNAPPGFDSEEFAERYTYSGDDLGAVYKPEKTVFTVWAPGAEALEVLIFPEGQADIREEPQKRAAMKAEKQGVWRAEIKGDWKNTYYLYAVKRDGLVKQTVDLYAKAVGVNGQRGMIVDLASTDPPGFREQKRPPLASPTDAVIYELHIRDLSMHPQSGIQNRGKFLGLTEEGTKNAAGLSTGIDHIRELGVTHIHLLPSFDFKTIDERKPETQFNWGYDPQNYNVPEGSYSTDPYNGAVRIREFKQMVQALHAQGLRVVMDVVYNHTFDAAGSNFTVLVPGYYYRMKTSGEYSNGSACGNETASERPMMQKFMVDSVSYWAREYAVDGFRFDLMGLHDIATMNRIRVELDKIDPGIIMYGEGWVAGDTPLPEGQRALKANAPRLHERIAVFADDMRDGVKGGVFYATEPGFVNASTPRREEDVKFGVIAGTPHPGVNISRVSYSRSFWAKEPSQTINYASAHDNLSLWDKLAAAGAGAGDEELLAQNKLAAAIVLTSQGIPFFQAGEEMARTKGGDENSYRSPDSVNQLDWERKSRFSGLVDYYRGLLELRKQYACFRLQSAEAIRSRLTFLPSENGIILYTLDNSGLPGGKAAEAGYSSFILIFNGLTEERRIELPPGNWDLLVNGETAGIRPLARVSDNAVSVPGKTALVLGRH